MTTPQERIFCQNIMKNISSLFNLWKFECFFNLFENLYFNDKISKFADLFTIPFLPKNIKASTKFQFH